LTANNGASATRLPVILGPTAVGKSDLAMRLCKDLEMELLSCDSRQIYRSMDIGTAKPTAEQRKTVAHWMIDIVDPNQGYSCFQFAEDALAIIRERADAGKRLLICGGSGLYFNSLRKGLGPMVAPDTAFREKYYAKARLEGNQSIFDELTRVDPVTASISHPSNVQRNIRALEVYYHGEGALSALKESARPPQGVDFFVMTCSQPRDVLYRRINDRVDLMVKSGLIDEFYSLRAKGYDRRSPGMQCVGYKELFEVEDGTKSLLGAIDAIKMNSRHYAKRRITWIRHQVEGREISLNGLDYEYIKNMVEEYLSSVAQ
jgi:tRNA dimethylallyltransferase